MENINDKIKFTDIATANNTASKKLKINENQISKIDGYVASISTEAKEDTSVIIPAETKEITAPEYSEEFEKAVSDTIGEPVTVEQSEMDSWTDFATQLQEETEDKAITDIPEIITDPEREKIVEATRKAIDEELQREETVVKASPSRPIRYSFEEPVATEEKEETVFDQIGKKAAEIQEERKQNEISIPGKMAVIDNDANYKDLIAKIEEKRAELKKQNEINTAKRADTSTQNKIAEKYKAKYHRSFCSEGNTARLFHRHTKQRKQPNPQAIFSFYRCLKRFYCLNQSISCPMKRISGLQRIRFARKQKLACICQLSSAGGY